MALIRAVRNFTIELLSSSSVQANGQVKEKKAASFAAASRWFQPEMAVRRDCGEPRVTIKGRPKRLRRGERQVGEGVHSADLLEVLI
jgi:hypothetical protein